MYNPYIEIITQVEKCINHNTTYEVLIKLLKPIGLTGFSTLMISMPNPNFPKISQILPTMSSESVQKKWTGFSGITLLNQSLDFVKTVVATIAELRKVSINDFSVLDFGCGYGRLARLFFYYIDQENFYGVDPWDKSIEECHNNRISKNILLSDWLPSSLPFEERKFDLIYSFSVFTHLSERATKQALNTLHRYLKDDGILVITIRPIEYWNLKKDLKDLNSLIDLHEQKGFAFRPHNREAIDGDITYGDTSMTLDYLTRNFSQYSIVKTDFSLNDPYQLYIFLEKASSK